MLANIGMYPECGDIVPLRQAAVVNEEGCTGSLRPECYACGFSEC